MAALRDWVLGAGAETVAVGDQEPDLAMFGVATHSFAPSNIACANQARHLGCRIAHQPFQRGLLEIAGSIADRHGRNSAHDAQSRPPSPCNQDLFMELLRVSDRSSARNLLVQRFN